MDATLVSGKLALDLQEHKLIVIACSCAIEYWGRSRSVVGSGDRLILFKPDSTIIIHSLSGFKPLNWMSPPTDSSVEVDGSKIIVFSQRTVKPFEEIRIRIEKIIDYHSYSGLRDKEELDLTHNERDMRDYLAKRTELIHPEFKLKSVEYRTPLGFLDLYGKIGGRYAVVELKAEKAGLPAALQIKRYKEWLCGHLKQDVVSFLVAPSITPNALTLLRKEGVEFIKFNIRDITDTREKHAHTLRKWMK